MSTNTIGYVTSISGDSLSASVAPDVDLPTIGDMIRIQSETAIAFGLISDMEIPQPSHPPSPNDVKVMSIDLLGEKLTNPDKGELPGFQRGVSRFPVLGAEVEPVQTNELAEIYARPDKPCFTVGALSQEQKLPAYIMTDALLGKHFAILGTTGSGKSCSLTVILKSILDSHPCGHIILIDPHNEYSAAFKDKAESLSPESLRLPYWLLNFEESVEIFCSKEPTARNIEAGILKDAILTAKLNWGEQGPDANTLTVDTPVPYKLSDLVHRIDEMMGQLGKPEQLAPFQRLKNRLENLRGDRRYAFMFGNVALRDNMSYILSQLMRIPNDGKPVSIFDLSGVPSEVVDVMVSLLCRTMFDLAVWGHRHDPIPILVVCEEAHRYVPYDKNSGFAPTRKALEQIAKEGRKYGVSLGLITQRPSELSETILSQCNTMFSLRMSNERDQMFVQRTLPQSSSSLLKSLPSLRNQEAIVVGEGVNFPTRIRFHELSANELPESNTASFAKNWAEDRFDANHINYALKRWRTQSRES
ncbi:ATP-binding protein [Kiloniella sp.]|uniref:ATP-binding protein n=1 Tax=Kiloniella sp. TaxID=1938587 RepID=UPI003A9599AF